ncbi:hypothetical protein TNCV_3235991 [Trichonephila clavipes]|nr:hypothetical protein TNCV_3235991 [Trichonephila clavipes]
MTNRKPSTRYDIKKLVTIWTKCIAQEEDYQKITVTMFGLSEKQELKPNISVLEPLRQTYECYTSQKPISSTLHVTALKRKAPLTKEQCSKRCHLSSAKEELLRPRIKRKIRIPTTDSNPRIIRWNTWRTK